MRWSPGRKAWTPWSSAAQPFSLTTRTRPTRSAIAIWSKRSQQPTQPRARPSELVEAVAHNLFKLMAYKDEYEVARLYTDGTFLRKLQRQFEGDFTLQYHLAPPLLARRDPVTGVPRKRAFGPWMIHVFRLLARLRQQPEHMDHPRTERALARHASDRIAPRQQLRREMELQAEVALELALEFPEERAVGVEARDLVLVLVGHQLEEVAGDRPASPPRPRALRARRRDALDALAVALRVGRVLVRGEQGCAVRDDLVERLRPALLVIAAARLAPAPRPRAVVRGEPAPRERALVPRDRRAVQLDRALERGEADSGTRPCWKA